MTATMIPMTVLVALLALAGCTASTPDPGRGPTLPPANTAPVPADRVYTGWYMQQDKGEYFQPCGESTRYRIDSRELRSRASAFGLGQDNPVYVRVWGRPSPQASVLLVSRVESFGSPTPIRDCPMTGVVISAPG